MDLSIFEVGSKIATPLGLAGFVVAVLYLLYRALLRSRLLSRLGSKHSFQIISRITTFVFVLAVLAMFLGLGGYIMRNLGNSQPINITNTEFSGDMSFINISVIEQEYKQTQGEPLTDQDLKQKIESATSLAKAGKYTDAINLFREVAQKAPLASVYNNLGVLYAGANKYEDARQAYEKAIEKNPESQPAHLNLGLLLEREGRIEEAKRYFEKAPNSQLARQRTDELEKVIEKKLGQESIESEPNNEILKPNLLPLEKWINGSIESESDVDYFKFATPQYYRDIIKVEVKNQSNTLKPYLALWGANKEQRWQSSPYDYKVTSGQNLEYSFSTEPNSVYYISIGGLGTQGVYEAKITPLKAYDSYEPNDDILHTKPISLGTPIEASIMDGSDEDFYFFNSSSKSPMVIISVENQSASLKPYLAVYSANKVLLWQSSPLDYKVTSGQNLEHSFSVDPNTGYYAVIGGLGTRGDYRLNVREASEDMLQTVK